MARFSDGTYLKQWRERQVAISLNAVMARLFLKCAQNSEEADLKESFTERAKNTCSVMLDEIEKSVEEDDNAYKLSYLRNYTSAYYLATSRPHQNPIEVFDEEFRYITWVAGDGTIKRGLGEDECRVQLEEAQKLCRYMELTVHIYTNHLLNLAQEKGLATVTDETLINELKTLHEQLEEQGMYDEIAVIRYQLIQQVCVDTPEFFHDEAAARVFQLDAYELLNENNTKPMQREPVGGVRG